MKDRVLPLWNCKILFIVLFSFLGMNMAHSQRETNYIFLFDCTGSMKSNGIWEKAQAALNGTIQSQSAIPGATFTVIPFGDNPYTPISFTGSEFDSKKKEIESEFAKNIKAAQYTNLSGVLLDGFSRVDPNKDNKIFLLTDGLPNHGDTSEKVAETITKWCSNHRNCKLFYVALTEGIVNPVIKNAIDACQDAYVVQCSNNVIPQFYDISSTNVYTNLQELNKPMLLLLNLPGKHKVVATSDNPYFNIRILNNGDVINGKLSFILIPKEGVAINDIRQKIHDGDYFFSANFQLADKNLTIANPAVRINVDDNIPSKLVIADGVEEIKGEDIDWYDSFLWSDAAEDKETSWDLKPIFSNEMASSNLKLKFTLPEGENQDFEAWYNGRPIKTGDIISIEPGKPAILKVKFEHNAKTGKRYFNLIPMGHNSLDMVNNQPVENYEGTSLRTSFNVGWNPLKTFFFWLTILIIALLILWFLFIRNQKYPKFNKGRITIQSPYFATIRVKGYRKIVFTSKSQSQGFFDKIWKGKILYHANPIWPSNVEISPSGKNMRFRSLSNSLICSPQPLLMRGASYEITDTENPSFKIVINVN